MTRKELNELKIGDLCELTRGQNNGRIGEVALIEEGAICMRSIDGEPFWGKDKSQKLILVDYKYLKLVKDEG